MGLISRVSSRTYRKKFGTRPNKAPNMFKQRNIGKTLVTKTIGNKVAADGLKHRVYDNFQLRLFVVGFTAKDQKQVKGTTYCQSHQAKSIRKIMVDTMQKTASSGDIQNLVKNLLVDTIASDITKQVKSIYPLENVHVQKVKTIKRPKLDLGRLAELHGQSGVKTNAKGEKVERADHYEPAVQETV